MSVLGILKKLSVVTLLVAITTILHYNNLSKRSNTYYLREAGHSKMSDRELYASRQEEAAQSTIKPAAAVGSLSVDTEYNKRREIYSNSENVSISSQQRHLPYSSRQLKESKSDREASEGGYVLADDYWEQQNSGCRNLQSLQCWAANVNMKVVEPFIANSVPHTLPSSANSAWLRYSSMFDMDGWNRESSRLNHSILAPWEEFLTKARRNVITVEFEYAYSKDVQRKQNELKANPDQLVDINCKPNSGWPKSNQLAFLRSNNFTIVRKVCLNFEYGKYLTLTEFRNIILGEYSPGEVTIIFKQWRGLGIVGRILVKESGCGNTGIQENMQPSQRLYSDARKYASTYLTGNFSKYIIPASNSVKSIASTNGYIAVMARLEKSKLSFNKRQGIVPFCFEQILKYTRQLVEESHMERVFLSIDIGKFGSKSFKNTGDSSDLNEEFEKFFKNFYGGRVTIREWEQTFQAIGNTDDSGYVALLQKMVVNQAKCVIFVGGGAFQKHALNLYKSSHPKEQWCIHIIKECTVDKNLPMDPQ